MPLAAALALFTVTRSLPDEYPFGPFEDAQSQPHRSSPGRRAAG